MQIGAGILAIWNDCSAEDTEGYEKWYLGEHLVERLSIPGFRWGRRYRRLSGASEALPEYMTYYETDSAEVLTSQGYLARVNDPTPEDTPDHEWRLQEHEPHDLSEGFWRRCDPQQVCLWPSYRRTADCPHWKNCRSRALKRSGARYGPSAEPKDQDVSEEESLRGPDAKIAGCALIDCASEQDALGLAAGVALPGTRASAYELTYSLNGSDLPARQTNP